MKRFVEGSIALDVSDVILYTTVLSIFIAKHVLCPFGDKYESSVQLLIKAILALLLLS